MQSLHDERWVNPDRPTIVAPYEATTRPQATGAGDHLRPLDTHAVGEHALGCACGPVRLLSGEPAEHRRSEDAEPLDQVTGVISGAPQQFGEIDARSNECEGGPQPLSRRGYGAPITSGNSACRWNRANTVRRRSFRPACGTSTTPGQPYQAEWRDPSQEGGMFLTAGAFLTDAITVGDRSRSTRACGSTTAAPSARTFARSMRKVTRPTAPSRDWARCIRGISFRRALG